MKNQQGGLLISILLFSATMTVAVTMTVDYFKFNRSVQAVVLQTKAKSILLDDLENQVKIASALRQSFEDPKNAALKNCVLGLAACTSPQEFILASPMVAGDPIAGTKVNPVSYTKLGVRCKTDILTCDHFAASYFTVNAGKINLWVMVKAAPDSAPGTFGLPTKSYDVADFLALKF